MFRVFSTVKEVSEFNESLQRDEELQSSRSFLMGLKVKTRLFDDGDTRFPPDQTGALKSSYLLVSVNTSNTFMCALPVKIKHSWGWGCAGVLWLDHTPLCAVSLFELVFILNDGELTRTGRNHLDTNTSDINGPTLIFCPLYLLNTWNEQKLADYEGTFVPGK